MYAGYLQALIIVLKTNGKRSMLLCSGINFHVYIQFKSQLISVICVIKKIFY